MAHGVMAWMSNYIPHKMEVTKRGPYSPGEFMSAQVQYGMHECDRTKHLPYQLNNMNDIYVYMI